MTAHLHASSELRALLEDEQRRKLAAASGSARRRDRRWRLVGFPLTLLALGALAGVVLAVAMGGIG